MLAAIEVIGETVVATRSPPASVEESDADPEEPQAARARGRTISPIRAVRTLTRDS
jgi:hypothetical protein